MSPVMSPFKEVQVVKALNVQGRPSLNLFKRRQHHWAAALCKVIQPQAIGPDLAQIYSLSTAMYLVCSCVHPASTIPSSYNKTGGQELGGVHLLT